MKREFAKELLMEWGLPWDVYGMPPLLDKVVDTSRWSEHHALVFMAPDDGKVWRVMYEKGLTEIQDQQPWDSEDRYVMLGNIIDGIEVRPEEVTITTYTPVED